MKPRGLILIGFGAGLLLGLAVLAGLLWPRLNFASRPEPVVGKTAPDFELQNLAGETLRLSDLRGKPVLLNFWGTWCGPCSLEMPIFQHYARQYPGLVVAAVNAGEGQSKVKTYAEKRELEFPILLDPGQKILSLYRVTGLPTTFFLDAEGRIQSIHIGGVTEQRLVEYLKGIGIGE